MNLPATLPSSPSTQLEVFNGCLSLFHRLSASISTAKLTKPETNKGQGTKFSLCTNTKILKQCLRQRNDRKKILFPQSRTSSKRVLLGDYRLSTGQSLASILPYASLVKNIRTLQEPISSISYKSGKLSCRASHHEKRRSVYYLHIQIRRW